jgi:hypothetical protein
MSNLLTLTNPSDLAAVYRPEPSGIGRVQLALILLILVATIVGVTSTLTSYQPPAERQQDQSASVVAHR